MISGASPMLIPTDDPVSKIVFAAVAVAFCLLCFVALVMLLAAVFPKMTARSRHVIDALPVRVLFVGAAGYFVSMGLAAWLYSQAVTQRLLETEVNPAMFAVATVFAAVPLLTSLLGAPGMFVSVGDRLAAVHGGTLSGLRRLALATIISALAAFFPVLGWFVVLPMLLVATSGGFVVGLLIPPPSA